MKFKLIVSTLLLIVSSISAAGIYKWVDENGKTHFSDQKPAAAKQAVEEVTLEINSIEQVSYESDVFDRPSVIMYGTSWCGYCTKARRYFKQNNIQFTELDIEADEAAYQQFNELNGTGTPLIVIDDLLVRGFNVAALNEIFGL